jgi:hypothetical protein
MELARKLSWASLASSLVLAVAAIVSNATGIQLDDGSGQQVNSHASGTWVLGALAVVFLIHSLFLFSWANEQLWATRPRDQRR